ncbi:hypothetical protein R3P38DRAFT_3306971 [Favolaschia claudopus]|uniref:Membrane anchor Opy2 N-terminal domain-containing protein n=1 Tax=Favolaschia claudopus TaxID=2862362 RepID=A0AAW0DI51_9AGAR
MVKFLSLHSLVLASFAIGAVLATPLDAAARDDKCVICTEVVPQCDCAEGQECIIVEQTCQACAHAICNINPAPAVAAKEECVICTQQIPECHCEEGQECLIIGQTCTTCAHAVCVVPSL